MSLALGGENACIFLARRAAAGFLTGPCERRQIAGAAVTVTVQNAQLIGRELVTNVIKYAPGPGLLQLRITESASCVDVWDSDLILPRAHTPDAQRVGWHGLEIVAALAHNLKLVDHAGRVPVLEFYRQPRPVFYFLVEPGTILPPRARRTLPCSPPGTGSRPPPLQRMPSPVCSSAADCGGPATVGSGISPRPMCSNSP